MAKYDLAMGDRNVFQDNADPLMIMNGCLEQAVEDQTFPGAVLLVGNHAQILSCHAAGRLDSDAEAPPVRTDTIFDLASLTKPLATTLGIMLLVQDGLLEWDQPIGEVLQLTGSSPLIQAGITLSHLLSHCSGLPAYSSFYYWLKKYSPQNPKAWVREHIVAQPLRSLPGECSIYSDLGFMLLEWTVEYASGQSLDSFTRQRIYTRLGLERTDFFGGCEHAFEQGEFASTGICRFRKQRLQGIVHDRNAWAVGGVNGHAGLFSTATDLWRLLSELYAAYQGHSNKMFDKEIVRRMWKRCETPPGTTWALGFDTPRAEDSSAGNYFSAHSVGHLGFTGCSFWLDLCSGIIVILLSNRTASNPPNIKIRRLRPFIHDLAYGAAQKWSGSGCSE
jgi:serine-type D-Ala-D-Ala carboxypeptidase